MYIDLGDEILVNTKEIVAILDKESVETSTNLENFHHCDREASLQEKWESVKSIVVTMERIYYSPLATSTLKKRVQKRSV